MMSLDEFAAALEDMRDEAPIKLAIGLEKIGELAKTLAAEYPGTYQRGWAPLAESTLRDKERQGYPTPSPLLRTGEMAASYEKAVDPVELEVTIGSEDPVALYQEMGTSKMPPRPVVSLALQNSLPYAKDTLVEIAKAIVTDKPV